MVVVDLHELPESYLEVRTDRSPFLSPHWNVPLESGRHTWRQPGKDKPVKPQHANGELQARRPPIASSSDVLEGIAKCAAMELEHLGWLSRSRTGFRLQKIKPRRARCS